MTVVLDSWAIIRYLEDDGPAAERVAELLDSERPIVSWINLGEVFSVIRRARGDEIASSTVRDLREMMTAELPIEDRVLEAARIKSDYPMAHADAFAAATALAHDAILWTGDTELLLPGSRWMCEDLRAPGPPPTQ